MPLQSVFTSETWDLVAELEAQAQSATEASRIAIQSQIDTLEQYDECWISLFERGGDQQLAEFVRKIDEWLKEPIDWSQSEWFGNRTAQGGALEFFRDQPRELLEQLGVVVIEGEHPGSSYYAAELREDIDKANEVAAALKLPFRFKKDTS